MEPVFLCGYPKSGTTLLLALLDHHPELVVFPEETWFFLQIYNKPEAQNIEYALTRTGSDAFRYGEVEWSSGYRDYRSIDFKRYEKLVYQFWQQSQQTVFDILESQIRAYQEVTNQQDKRFWVEKTPKNEHFLPVAFDQYPAFKAIYILRDPRDNFASYRLQRQKKKQLLRINTFIHSWVDSLYHWAQFVHTHREQALTVTYRELTSNPEQTMQRIADFLTISYDDCLLQPTRNGVFWSGNSMHGVKHHGISSASRNNYRQHLTEAEIKHLEHMLKPILEHFELELDYQVPIAQKIFRYYKNRIQQDHQFQQRIAAIPQLLSGK